jgi:hypothetical protein
MECICNQSFASPTETSVLQAKFIPLVIGRKIVKLGNRHKPSFRAFSAWIRYIGDGIFVKLWDCMITDKNTAEEYALKFHKS